MTDAIVLAVTAVLVLVAVVGLMEVSRRLRDRRRLREELARLLGEGPDREPETLDDPEDER